MKEIIKQFIPPVFLILLNLRRRYKSLIPSSLQPVNRQTNKLILIGNGPSLNDSMKKYNDCIVKYDRLVVNFMASSDIYEMIKPNYYLFADPAFFDIPPHLKEKIDRLAEDIVRKTKWEMMIVIPEVAKDAPLTSILRQNQYISFNYFRTDFQNIGKMPIYEAWDKNYLTPHFQNVLNVGVYLSLFWGYPETYLIGADTSSLEDIRIDQNTNELFSIDKHFYNNQNEYLDHRKFDSNNCIPLRGWTLHDYIFAIGRMIQDYSELKKYADYKGLKVYNACEYSWINCYERKFLS